MNTSLTRATEIIFNKFTKLNTNSFALTDYRSDFVIEK